MIVGHKGILITDTDPTERARVYALLSIALPIVTLATVYILQSRGNPGLADQMLEAEDSMQLFEAIIGLVKAMFYTMLACIAGLVLAIKSITLRGHITTLGYLSLGLNGPPAVIAAISLRLLLF